MLAPKRSIARDSFCSQAAITEDEAPAVRALRTKPSPSVKPAAVGDEKGEPRLRKSFSQSIRSPKPLIVGLSAPGQSDDPVACFWQACRVGKHKRRVLQINEGWRVPGHPIKDDLVSRSGKEPQHRLNGNRRRDRGSPLGQPPLLLRGEVQRGDRQQSRDSHTR